ncbi:anti-sigma factor, partial [Rhizobiaceae sp. 2RAB30]
LAGRTNAPDVGALAMAPIGSPAIVKVLDTAPSGQAAKADDATIKLISSFHDEAGTLCREFEFASTSTVISVACHAAGRWDVRLAVAAPAAGADYVPAGAAEAVDAYLTSIHAGAPLSETDEAAALSGLQPR